MYKTGSLDKLVIESLLFKRDSEIILHNQLIKYPQFANYFDILVKIIKRLENFIFLGYPFNNKNLSKECIKYVIKYTPFHLLYKFLKLKFVLKNDVLDLIILSYEANVEYFKVFDIKTLEYFDHQTDQVCFAAIHKDTYALNYIRNQNYEICCEAMKKDFYAINYVYYQTPQICLKAIDYDSFSFKFIRNKTFEICLKAIKKNASLISYIENPCRELCLEAVKQAYYIIRYIANPSEEVCQMAIKHDVMALKFIPNPSKILCIFAIKINPIAISYIKNQTHELCMIALAIDPFAITAIKNQSFEMCLEFLKYISSLSFIEYLTPKLSDYIVNNQTKFFRYNGIIKEYEEDFLKINLAEFKKKVYIVCLRSSECFKFCKCPKNGQCMQLYNIQKIIKVCLAEIYELNKWHMVRFKTKLYSVYLYQN
jgi:hypothetical protein